MSDEANQRRVPEWLILTIVFLCAVALVISRRPDAVTNPQFFGEDGFWFSKVHDDGPLGALLAANPNRGYFYAVPMLGACLAMLVPLRYAPLVMNVIAIAIMAAPAVLICSSRFAAAVPPLWGRIAIAFLYLALPNTWGLIGSAITSQWYHGALGLAIVIATPGERLAWRVFDVVALFLLGLSGPIALFLVPVIALKWWVRRERWMIPLFAIAAATSAVQVITTIVREPPSTMQVDLGATPMAFFKLTAVRVAYAVLFGETRTLEIVTSEPSAWTSVPAILIGAVVVLAVFGAAAWKGPLELRLVLVFTALITGASLVGPMPLAYTQTYWEVLARPGAGNRYAFFPVLALLVSLFWLATRKPLALRIAGTAALAVVCIGGVRRDWREAPHRDFDYPGYVRQYELAAPGERVQIPHPPNWGLVLTKR